MPAGVVSRIEWSRIIRRASRPFKAASRESRRSGSPGRQPEDRLRRLAEPRVDPLRLLVGAKGAVEISRSLAHPPRVHLEGRELAEDGDSPIELRHGP